MVTGGSLFILGCAGEVWSTQIVEITEPGSCESCRRGTYRERTPSCRD